MVERGDLVVGESNYIFCLVPKVVCSLQVTPTSAFYPALENPLTRVRGFNRFHHNNEAS